MDTAFRTEGTQLKASFGAAEAFAGVSERTRTTLVLASFLPVYCLTVLWLDIQTGATGQAIIGLATWLFLAVAIRFSPWDERVQVLTMVGVATIFECFGSLIWGLYVYRLDNLPLYVPPGHGLFYLMALRLSELPFLRRYARSVIWLVFVAATVLLTHNLIAPSQPDQLGLITWVLFLPFILRGRFRLLYQISFGMTMALEFYGTGVGAWTWQMEVPLVQFTSANPPACIGSAYCVMDAVARYLAPRAQEPLERLLAFGRFHLEEARSW